LWRDEDRCLFIGVRGSFINDPNAFHTNLPKTAMPGFAWLSGDAQRDH
jgi:hypothetical protein